MIFILVKDGPDVIEKSVFAGDDTASQTIISRLQSLNPQWEYLPVNEEAFNDSVLKPARSPQQTAWETAKAGGVAGQLSFLAKRMGLE